MTSSSIGGTISYNANGNIKNKTGVDGTTTVDYTYDATHPHAVATAFGYTVGYDANGDLTSRSKSGETWSFNWAGFDKPRWMIKNNGSTVTGNEFLYNASRSRVIHLEMDGANGTAPTQTPGHYTHKKIYGAGPALEIEYKPGSSLPWAHDRARVYIPAPDGIVGTYELILGSGTTTSERAEVYHYDHLGSIDCITPFGQTGYATDDAGKSSRYNEDAWGQRRNPLTWSGAPSSATSSGGHTDLTPRGFTRHEMLDGLGLVHMNGRIYDPLLGRFLSADLVVQFPGSLQSYNRYSYVENNPLTRLDPTGWYSIMGLEFTDGGGVGGFFKDLGGYGGNVVMGAVGDNMVAGYKAGTDHMAAGMTEIGNAHGGLDATIGGLHMIAAVGTAVGVVLDVTPEGKAEKLATEGVEKLATKAESAVTHAVEKAEAKAATIEKRVEGVTTGTDSRIAAIAPTTEAAAAKQSGSASAQLGKSLEAAGQARPEGAAAAHIVPTGNFSQRSESVRNAISTAQAKFNKFLGGDARNGASNGFWSKDSTHAGTHTDKFFSALGEAFKDVASKKDAEDAIALIRKRIEDGEFLKK